MRQLVVIDQRTTVQDSAGQPVATWTHFATRRAEVKRLEGREFWAAEQRLGRVPTVFSLRYMDGVSPKMRLTCNGRFYDIVSAVDPDGMRAELVVTALELVDETVPR